MVFMFLQKLKISSQNKSRFVTVGIFSMLLSLFSCHSVADTTQTKKHKKSRTYSTQRDKSASSSIEIDATSNDEIIISNTHNNVSNQTNKILSASYPYDSTGASSDELTVAKTSAIISPRLRAKLTLPLPFEAIVAEVAELTQLDSALIHAVIAVESGYNQHALSAKGAFGLMQLMPETFADYSRNKTRPSAKENILAGASYLRELIQLFNGNLSLALAAYNAGPGAVKKYDMNIPPYPETQRYVPKVLACYELIKSQLLIKNADLASSNAVLQVSLQP